MKARRFSLPGIPARLAQDKAQVVGGLLSDFPAKLYVRLEEDGDEQPIVIATREVEGSHGDSVAIYELVEVRKIKVTKELA